MIPPRLTPEQRQRLLQRLTALAREAGATPEEVAEHMPTVAAAVATPNPPASPSALLTPDRRRYSPERLNRHAAIDLAQTLYHAHARGWCPIPPPRSSYNRPQAGAVPASAGYVTAPLTVALRGVVYVIDLKVYSRDYAAALAQLSDEEHAAVRRYYLRDPERGLDAPALVKDRNLGERRAFAALLPLLLACQPF